MRGAGLGAAIQWVLAAWLAGVFGCGGDSNGSAVGFCQDRAPVACDGQPSTLTVDGVEHTVQAFFDYGVVYLVASTDSACGAYNFVEPGVELGIVGEDVTEDGCYDAEDNAYAASLVDFGQSRWFGGGPTALWIDVIDSCVAGSVEIDSASGFVVSGSFRAEICP